MKKVRSLFVPFALMAAGVIWFLVNAGIVPKENIWALAYYWPFLLVAAGLSLILGSYWAYSRVIISALVVSGAVLVIVFAPRLGWNQAPTWSIAKALGDTNGAVAGSRQVTSETRPLKSLDAVTFDYPAKVVIQQGEAESIIIKADDNLLPQLGTRIEGNTLYFESTEKSWNKRVRPSRTVEVILTVKNLQELDFNRAGDALINGFKADKLKVTVSGAGDITLTKVELGKLGVWLSGAGNIKADGTAPELEVHIAGVGNFDGRELAAKTAEVTISGLGSATLWVTETLNAGISGSGSINYYGSPVVHKVISGLGTVNQMIGK
jgi:hypothetical protein